MATHIPLVQRSTCTYTSHVPQRTTTIRQRSSFTLSVSAHKSHNMCLLIVTLKCPIMLYPWLCPLFSKHGLC